jgi:flagellar motor switch protein FliN/FliY
MDDTALMERPAATAEATPRSVDHLLGLEIPVTVSFGEREIALRDLAALGPGSVLELDRPASAPVDLLVNGRVVARGDLVLLDDQYAVRITQVVSSGDRIRTLGRGTVV